MPAKKKAPVKKKAPMKTEEKPEEDAPVETPVEAPEEEAPPSAIDLIVTHLDALEKELIATIEKVKEEIDGETAEQMRLGAVRFLKEGKLILDDARVEVAELQELHGTLSLQQKSLDDARAYIDSKSAAYRSQHDAFMKLHELTEAELQHLIDTMRSGDKEVEEVEETEESKE